jgi:hypothetical protein
MENTEAIEMMSRCSDEIKAQRRQIELLRPKAEAFDVLKTVVSLIPGPSHGYGEDVAWRLDKRIEELRKEQQKNATDNVEKG